MARLNISKKVDTKKVGKFRSFLSGSILRKKIRPLGMAVLALLFLSPSLYAMDITTGAEIENLKRRLQRLEGTTEKAADETEKDGLTVGTLLKNLTFNGVVEIEANFTKTENAQEQSDLVLATAQLGFDFKVNDYVGGHIVLLHEEGEPESVVVDEGNITIFKPLGEDGRIGLVAGRFYQPFGHFNSSLLTDPLTVEMAETNNTGLQFTIENKYFGFNGSVFSGETDAIGDDDHIETVVASLNVTPFKALTIGGYFMSDLAESDIGLVGNPMLYADSVGTAGGFLSLDTGFFVLNAEYITAIDSFDAVVLGGDLTGRDPEVWTAEAGIIPMEAFEIAARYEKAKDFMDDISRYGGVISFNIYDNTILGLEYLLEEPDIVGNDVHTVTAQLAVEF